jgi:predicted glycoside hydrolase/deacetylase ChbG (UPF0249 family)
VTIQLIINADDFGRTLGVSTGIREAHLRGIVTSTTAMMNMPDTDEALRQVMRDCPRLGLGVHLVLTCGVPLLPQAQVKSLTDSKGNFYILNRLVRQLSSLDLAEVRAEWRAQIEKFVSVTGLAPDHLDSHHHSSYYPPLFRIMLELAREYQCAIRLPFSDKESESFGDLPPDLARQALQEAHRLLAEFQPPCPDHVITSFYDLPAPLSALVDILERLPDGITEIMCHPGIVDNELLGGSSYNSQRQAELTALTDAAVAEKIKASGIELVNFSQLGKIHSG